MFNPLLSGFLLLLLLTGCGWDGTATRNNDFTPLTSIEILADSPAIAAHTSTRLSVIGHFSGLFTRDITPQVVWSSAAPAVADFVSPATPNRVSGQAPGSAVLTAAVGNVSSTFTLTVSPATVTSLTIAPAGPSIAKGLGSQFVVSGAFSDGTNQDLTFDADWASSTPAVATISNAAGSKGLAQALAVGTSTITATFDGVSGTTLLTVTTAALQTISVLPANPTILSLSRTAFTAVGSYSDGSTADITNQALWSSSSAGIAEVTSGGAARTITPGTTLVSATLAGISGKSSLKVTGGFLTGITISPANPRLVRDTAGRMTAKGTFSNGSTRDISGAVDWTVANPAFATVTTPGGNLALLNPLAVTAGTIVTARSGTVFAETGLTVTAPRLTGITIAPTSLDLTNGTSDRLTVTALFDDGSTQDVTIVCDWTSDAAATAPVGNSGTAKGRVSGAADGPAIISASYGGLTARSTVTVRTRLLQDLIITGVTATTVGNQVTLTATASYSDGSKVVTEDTDWSIDDTNIATLADALNQPGQVVMVDGGLATLTASFGNKSITVPLTSRVP